MARQRKTRPRRYKDKYPSGRKKGFINYSPRGNRLLVNQILELRERYEAWLPMHPRSFLYRLLEEYGYDKTDAFWGSVKNVLTNMRRGRLIAFEDIGDNRAQVHEPPVSYNSPANFWRNVRYWAEDYRCKRDRGQPCVVELWVEAAGTVGLVERIAHEYGIKVYTASGFNGIGILHELAKRAVRRSVPTVVLHLGDLDSSGECIYDAMAEDVRLFTEGLDECAPKVMFVRVALTREQQKRFKLPTKPAKSTDNRGDFKGGTVQLEALKPPVLAQIVEDAILERYDRATWEAVVEREAEERAELMEQVERYLPDDE